MASKAFQPNHAFELPHYPTIPTIDPEELERAQVRARELQARAVRDAFSGLFRALIGLARGTQRRSDDSQCSPPIAASNPG